MPIKEHNFSQQELDIILNDEAGYIFGSGGNDYIRLTVFNNFNQVVNTFEDITIYPTDYQTDDTFDGDIYVKPNEILFENQVPEGNYKLQFDFLRTYPPSISRDIVIKQISPSRLEVRLKYKDGDEINKSSFKSIIGFENTYKFNWILYVGLGRNIPIVNYAFDPSDNSLILKLYEPLPNDITTLNIVKIEKEVLTTQIEDITYFSEVSRVESKDSLAVMTDTSEFFNQEGDSSFTYESYTDLTSSLFDQTIINNIISGSDLNLNIDYSDFNNYVFFGSAVQRLTNFKTKVGTIEDYLNDISESLSADGTAIGGDSTYLINRRTDLFNKIQDEINTFTPYERFLYYDAQSYSSASAPGIGENYSHIVPVAQQSTEPNSVTLENSDGFNIVYKHSNDTIGAGDSSVDLFTNKYYAHEKPFFNYSGSIYLSFILKGTKDISLTWDNDNKNATNIDFSLPVDAFYSNAMENPSITGSEWRRFVYQTSQSYWVPTATAQTPYDADSITGTGWDAGSNQYEILSGSIKTGSHAITAVGDYSQLATVVTQSDVPFSGSIMPAGELFRIYYTPTTSAVTSSFMTDIKVTLSDPTNILPFGLMYKTSSSDWTDWYNGLQDSASTYDDNNINSLKNNLPKYIRENSDYDELKTFLYMLGDHFDLIRNYIDNYVSFYKRNYQKVDSVPTNLMPILSEHFGWELINPFTGSMAEYLGGSESSVTSTEDITHNTWRKQLNNLIYLYKSKGTLNSIRALLNIYGYPPDVLGYMKLVVQLKNII
ncbi:MAG: hypothetical protein H8D94_01075 [Candidatus Pelagibacter sp.]|nr:hypothetical protein [Candidatus Pelagibacter sp.]